jgi:N-acetylglutamate synthase
VSRPELPDLARLYDVVEATWPAASSRRLGPWRIREGAGGGKRVSATTAEGAWQPGDIATAEAAMAALGQDRLFMIRAGDDALDAELESRGYRVIDPVVFYLADAADIDAGPPPPVSSFEIFPPLAIMREIWAGGGIGAGRLAVMDRVQATKTAILSRNKDRAAGVAFVALDGDIAMVHAIEVNHNMRRQGCGINILRAAGHWSTTHGARFFALIVTNANDAANSLYAKFNMNRVGAYHYRIK